MSNIKLRNLITLYQRKVIIFIWLVLSCFCYLFSFFTEWSQFDLISDYYNCDNNNNSNVNNNKILPFKRFCMDKKNPKTCNKYIKSF